MASTGGVRFVLLEKLKQPMNFRNTLSRNSGIITQLIFAGVCGFLPVLTTRITSLVGEKTWQGLFASLVLLILGFFVSLRVLHKLNNLSKEVIIGESEYKKQWELYARLSECQRDRQRVYFNIASLSIICLIAFLTLAIYYSHEMISIISIDHWWVLPSYFSAFLLIALYCMWEIYNCKINYYSNDAIQLLWDEIEKLRMRLDLTDAEKFKKVLEKGGNKEKFEKIVFEYGIGYQPKEYIEPQMVTTIEILDIEIDIINTPEWELINNMINMSQKEECSIDIELILSLPPVDVYRLIKTAYPKGLSDAFVKTIANRMPIKELRLALAQGLLSYYDTPEELTEFVEEVEPIKEKPVSVHTAEKKVVKKPRTKKSQD